MDTYKHRNIAPTGGAPLFNGGRQSLDSIRRSLRAQGGPVYTRAIKTAYRNANYACEDCGIGDHPRDRLKAVFVQNPAIYGTRQSNIRIVCSTCYDIRMETKQ